MNGSAKRPFDARITWGGILVAMCLVVASSGCSDRNEKRFQNHESRLDELENMVRGNDVGTAPRESSHDVRIKSLEDRLDKLEKQTVAPESPGE